MTNITNIRVRCAKLAKHYANMVYRASVVSQLCLDQPKSPSHEETTISGKLYDAVYYLIEIELLKGGL